MAKFQILFSNLFLLSIIYLLLTLSGFIIFRCLVKNSNKLLSIGSGMIIGPLGFLLVLGLGSYVFKGQLAILLMFMGYLMAVFLFVLKTFKFSFQHLVPGWRLRTVDTIAAVLCAGYLGLIFLFAHRSFIGSDSDMYFAIATSFAKGNYPVVQSWQPQFLTVYHQGTYLLEGALWSLTGKDIELVHYFSSVYFIWAIFLLLTGLVREKVRSIWCLLPAVFGLILVGGPVLLTKISSLSMFISSLPFQPDFTSFQSSNGAGVTNLATLIYTNFYTFGLAAFLVFGLLLLNQWKKNFSLLGYSVLLVIIILGLSVDETFFPVEIVLFGGLLIWQIRKSPFLKKVTNLSILSLIFMSLFLLIQNPIRDSLFTPSPEGPRFKVLLESNLPIFGTLFYHPREKTSWNGFSQELTATKIVESRTKYAEESKIGSWLRPDIRLIFAILFLGLIFAPSGWIFLLLISSILSYLLSLAVINVFWPPNGLRISNQAFQLSFLALAFLIINLLTQKSLLKKTVAAIIILLLLPQILTTHARLFTEFQTGEQLRNNYTKEKKDLDLENIVKYIPPGKAAIFLDRYPDPAPFSYLNYTALTKFGVYVPIAPPKVKILNPAPGIEWLDAVNTLEPYALKELNVEYAYIQTAALSRLSDQTREDLKNKDYFEEVKKFGEDGTLYKVSQAYQITSGKLDNLKQMSLIIGSGKKVYVDKLKFNEARKALILELAKNNTLVGIIPAHGGDFYMYIETLLPFEEETPGNLKNLDFVITDKEKDPNGNLPGKYEKILTNNYVSLWKN